jgi:hypothetical protein
MNVGNVSLSRVCLRGLRPRCVAYMFGIIEVEMGNDECNGHIMSIWHKRN